MIRISRYRGTVSSSLIVAGKIYGRVLLDIACRTTEKLMKGMWNLDQGENVLIKFSLKNNWMEKSERRSRVYVRFVNLENMYV